MSVEWLERGEGRVAYEVSGSGPLVVCAPGMGDLRAQYRLLAPALVRDGYTVATMDLRGLGASSAAWTDYSARGVGSDMLALARHLGAGPAFLVGQSMAAGAAVWAAAEGPDAVAGLVLLGPFVHQIPSPLSGLLRMVYPLLFADPWGASVWLRYYASLYPSRLPEDFAEYAGALRSNLRQPGRLHALRQMILATDPAADARLARVCAPTLVVMGTRDPDFKDPAGEADWVAHQLHGRVQMIEGAGHYPHVEMPEQTVPAVQAFLQSIRVTDRNVA